MVGGKPKTEGTKTAPNYSLAVANHHFRGSIILNRTRPFLGTPVEEGTSHVDLDCTGDFKPYLWQCSARDGSHLRTKLAFLYVCQLETLEMLPRIVVHSSCPTWSMISGGETNESCKQDS